MYANLLEERKKSFMVSYMSIEHCLCLMKSDLTFIGLIKNEIMTAESIIIQCGREISFENWKSRWIKSIRTRKFWTYVLLISDVVIFFFYIISSIYSFFSCIGVQNDKVNSNKKLLKFHQNLIHVLAIKIKRKIEI